MSEPPPLDPNLPQNVLLRPIKLAVDGMAGAFLIDPDHAEQFIAEVTSAAGRVDRAKSAAKAAGDLEPAPGGDPVTENAVIQAKRMADNAWKALDTYQVQLRETVDKLRRQLDAYRATEQANIAGQR